MSENIPLHVAMIPDGNRRWARKKGLKAAAGHVKAGSFEHMNSLFQEAKKLGIKYLSFWGFSTENWKRNKDEINKIFEIILKGADDLSELAHKEKIKFRHIGRKDRIPKKVLEKFDKLEKETSDYKIIYAIFCIDYGGRDEIVRAVNKAIADGKKKINEEEFNNYLDTAGIPEPDLIIRTGGEKRLSGFMPFQSDYSELYFTDVYFPDFNAKELRKAVADFEKRKRRFGGD